MTLHSIAEWSINKLIDDEAPRSKLAVLAHFEIFFLIFPCSSGI